jgi:hypothetical protein
VERTAKTSAFCPPLTAGVRHNVALIKEGNMELQKKLDEFRANFEMDIGRKTILDNEALRVKSAGVEARALKAGQRAPDCELSDMAGNKVALAQLRAEGPLALIFYRGLW